MNDSKRRFLDRKQEQLLKRRDPEAHIGGSELRRPCNNPNGRPRKFSGKTRTVYLILPDAIYLALRKKGNVPDLIRTAIDLSLYGQHVTNPPEEAKPVPRLAKVKILQKKPKPIQYEAEGDLESKGVPFNRKDPLKRQTAEMMDEFFGPSTR